MTNLEWARSQMAFSLAFHIIFASISMVMPFLMFMAYRNYLKKGREVDLRLTKAWMHGSAVLFATGAVSGTVLSFQLGLLWPEFMKHAGPIIGMPFSLEGAAFFLEAIFLGLFLYGWNRLSPKMHLFCALMVGVFGVISGILVVAANGWMNAPTGFDWIAGEAFQIDPWKAMFNAAWPLQAGHMILAAFQATCLAAAGLHALGLLRKHSKGFHSRALEYLLPIVAVSSLLQPLVGDLSAKSVAKRQPEKLAAMEAHFQTASQASLWLGGLPDEELEIVRYGIEIPGLLSFLAHGDFDAEVIGLDQYSKDVRPPVLPTHLGFQIMVGIGTLLAFFAVIYGFLRWKKRSLLLSSAFLRTLVLFTPLGFIALEAGWVVTEVGRQPWIIYHVLKTADAVTHVPGLQWSFLIMFLVYVLIGGLSFFLLGRWFVLESRKG